MKKHKGYSTKSNSFDIDKIEKGIKENKKRKENKNVQHEAKVRKLFNRIGHWKKTVLQDSNSRRKKTRPRVRKEFKKKNTIYKPEPGTT